MDLYYICVFFIFGSVLGSFYNVVGYRLPKGESIAFPASHCPNCNHVLTPIELIPIFSYLIQRGKCKNCKVKISAFYPIFELITGLCFAFSYYQFGMSGELLIALTLSSMLIILVISDYHYMIFPDSVLISFGLAIMIEKLLTSGGSIFFSSAIDGVIAFSMMYALKLFGDVIFKKESMGGGDIKLMLILGFVFGWETSIFLVFLAAFIGLPVSLFILYKKNSHEIPFGPFLATSALVILFSGIDMNVVINFLR